MFQYFWSPHPPNTFDFPILSLLKADKKKKKHKRYTLEIIIDSLWYINEAVLIKELGGLCSVVKNATQQLGD